MSSDEPVNVSGSVEVQEEEPQDQQPQDEDQMDITPVAVDEKDVDVTIPDADEKSNESTLIENMTPNRKKGTEIPPERRGEIYQRYLNGESMGNIAKAEGLSKSTIQHVVRKVKETGSTQTKPRCGRPLKQGELSRTTLRRRKLKGLMVQADGGAPDSPTPVGLNGTNDLGESVPYAMSGTIAGPSKPIPVNVNAPIQFQPAPAQMTLPTTTVVLEDIYGINHAVPTTDLQWRPAAYAIVIKGASILLLRQNGGAYDLPGGAVMLGEKPENAALRETKEETGINTTGPTLLGAESSLFRASHSDNKSYHSILMYYACAYGGGKISSRGLDAHEKLYIEGAEWVKLSMLEGIKVSSTVDFRPYVLKATAKQVPAKQVGAKSRQGATQQSATQQNATQQDATQQDATRQDAIQQDALQQDAIQQDITQQDITQQDATQQNAI